MVDEQAQCSGKMGEAEDDMVSDAEIDSEPEELMEVEAESEIDGEETCELLGLWILRVNMNISTAILAGVSFRTERKQSSPDYC